MPLGSHFVFSRKNREFFKNIFYLLVSCIFLCVFAFLVVMPIKKQYVISRLSRPSRARGLKQFWQRNNYLYDCSRALHGRVD